MVLIALILKLHIDKWHSLHHFYKYITLYFLCCFSLPPPPICLSGPLADSIPPQHRLNFCLLVMHIPLPSPFHPSPSWDRLLFSNSPLCLSMTPHMHTVVHHTCTLHADSAHENSLYVFVHPTLSISQKFKTTLFFQSLLQTYPQSWTNDVL